MKQITAIVLIAFLSSLILPVTAYEGNNVQIFRGNATYIGGLLTGPHFIDLTITTIDEKRELVSLYGYNLTRLDYSHGTTTKPAAWYADTYIGPYLRNTTENDICIVTSAGLPLVLYEIYVQKVPCKAKFVIVEGLNKGMPRHIGKLINTAAYATGGDVFDMDCRFVQDMHPDSKFMRQVRANSSEFVADVQIMGHYAWWFNKADFGITDLFGTGSMFKEYPARVTLYYPYMHEDLLRQDNIIEDAFAALSIEKLNPTPSNFSFLILKCKNVIPSSAFLL